MQMQGATSVEELAVTRRRAQQLLEGYVPGWIQEITAALASAIPDPETLELAALTLASALLESGVREFAQIEKFAKDCF